MTNAVQLISSDFVTEFYEAHLVAYDLFLRAKVAREREDFELAIGYLEGAFKLISAKRPHQEQPFPTLQ